MTATGEPVYTRFLLVRHGASQSGHAAHHKQTNPHSIFYNGVIMSKAQDSKKAVKKEPAKTMKEKKEAKKLKKEASKRQ